MVFNRRNDTRPVEAATIEVKSQNQSGHQQNGATPMHYADTGQSIIGSNLSIEGQSITIRCAGSLLVNGNIQADIHSTSLVVGEDGTVKGSIAADTVDVHGKVNGSIHGANVVLHGTAQVEGDIQSAYLTISRGATFDGSSRRVSESSILKPELTAKSSGQRFGQHGLNGNSADAAHSIPQQPSSSEAHHLQ